MQGRRTGGFVIGIIVTLCTCDLLSTLDKDYVGHLRVCAVPGLTVFSRVSIYLRGALTYRVVFGAHLLSHHKLLQPEGPQITSRYHAYEIDLAEFATRPNPWSHTPCQKCSPWCGRSNRFFAGFRIDLNNPSLRLPLERVDYLPTSTDRCACRRNPLPVDCRNQSACMGPSSLERSMCSVSISGFSLTPSSLAPSFLTGLALLKCKICIFSFFSLWNVFSASQTHGLSDAKSRSISSSVRCFVSG